MKNLTIIFTIISISSLILGCGSDRWPLSDLKIEQINVVDSEFNNQFHRISFYVDSSSVNSYKWPVAKVIEIGENTIILKFIVNDNSIKFDTPPVENMAFIKGKTGDVIHLMYRNDKNELVYIKPCILTGKREFN